MNIKALFEKITKDWPAKVICLCLAIFIYSFHQIITLDSKTLMIPMQIISDGNLTTKDVCPNFVKVVFRTDSSHIASVNSKDIKAFINLTAYTQEGFYDVPVQVELSEDLKTIEPLEIKIKPESFSLNLEEKILKYIPVVASTSGEPENGYYVSNLEVIPSSVKVVGPKSVVENTKQIYTKKVMLKGAKTNYSSPTKLDNINSLLKIYPESDFRVDIEISEKIAEKDFSNIEVCFLNLKDNFIVSSQTPKVSFTLSGSQRILEKFVLKPESVYIDLKKALSAGTFDFPVYVSVPDLLSVKKLTPQKVKISIEEKVFDSPLDSELKENSDGETLEHENNQEESFSS